MQIMKANVQYNDFKGTVALDISDGLGGIGGDNLESIGKYFGLDKNRFDIVGLSISGRKEFSVSMICVDKDRSTSSKEHIVKMRCNIENEDKDDILSILFKRLNIVIHDKFDQKYIDKDYDEEASFSDFHLKEDDEE